MTYDIHLKDVGGTNMKRDEAEKLKREKTVSKILTVETKLYNHYVPEESRKDRNYPVWQRDNPYYAVMILKSTIEQIFIDYDVTVEEIKNLVKSLIKKNGLSGQLTDLFNPNTRIESIKKTADIRKDWAGALRNVKRGTQLSSKIDYAFSEEDISELAKLHKKNHFRKKIEALLEDCNFHTEYSDFSSGIYDRYIIA